MSGPGEPPPEGGGGWASIFGRGSIGEQFLVWGVGQQVIGALLAPALQGVTNALWWAATHGSAGTLYVPVSPSDLASMVVRGITDKATAEGEASKSGVRPADFQLLVDNAGEPPGLQFLLEAWRRGYVGWDDAGVAAPSISRAIKTSRVYDYWEPVIQKMAQVPISPGEAVNAVLRGQIPHDQGQKAAYASGISADDFTVLLNSAGRPPAPGELITLFRRGYIPAEGTGPDAISVQQGIFEGDAKDKWWSYYLKLAEYLPPPRTITALERSGAIDAAEAQSLYQQQGLSPRLAAVYSKSVTAVKVAGSKQLAESQVLTLFETQTIDQGEATTYLQQLGYSTAEIAFLLEYADLAREVRVLNSAITHIGTLYVGHKITRAGAQSALAALRLPPARQANLLSTWDVEQRSTVRPLTPAQITDAWEYGVMDQATAQAELVHLGYTPYDAWVVLSVKNKAPLPDPPAQGPAGPGVNP